ncbi:prolyl oligopeptidase family serine peptidase [Pontiellaceae bacterium B12227]|nr:prolyl oligopeptidase family serine peptidase [Pontiellaceae bacterium B12227]
MKRIEIIGLYLLLAGSCAWGAVLFEADFESGTTATTGTITYNAGYNVQTPVTGGSDATLGGHVLLSDPTSGSAAATDITLMPTNAVSLTGGQSAVVSLDVVWWRNNGTTKSHYLTGYDSDDNIIFQFVMADLGEFGNGGADRQRPGYADNSGSHAFTADQIASGVNPGSYWFGADTNPGDGLNASKDAHFEITVSSWGWSLYTVKQDGTTTAQTTTLPTYSGGVHSDLAYVKLTGETAAAGAYFDNLKIESVSGADLLPDIWLDASQGLGLVNERVSVWTNLAAPGSFDAVQTTASKRPALMYETWPGHQVIHFDGVDDILSLANTAGNALFEGEITVFYVGRTTGGSFSGTGGFVGNFQTGSSYKNGWNLRAQSDGSYHFLVGNGAWNDVAGGTALLGDDFVLLNGRYSNEGDGTGTMELFSSLLENPAMLSTTPFTPSPSSADISIGMFCGWQSLAFNQAVECDVAEIRIYGRALSDEDREAVWGELSAKYAVAEEQAVAVNSFTPSGYNVPADSSVEVTFNIAMNPASVSNIVVGIGGLDGLPENGNWVRASGQWTASAGDTVFTFTADPSFEPGDLVMVEIPNSVVSAGGTAYETTSRKTYAFIIENGVTYPVTTTLIDPMAIVYHDNGDEHILPLKLFVPDTDEPCPVMFWVNGGGWSGGNSGTWDRSAVGEGMMGDYLSEKLGVAVADVAWRSSSNSEGTFSKVVVDIGLAVEYVIAHADTYGLDVTRMGLYGGSAGTPTSALVSQNNTNINCYIGFNGLYDFVNRTGTGSFGGGTSFEQHIPSYTANSAALNVRTNNPPDSLFLHGSADTTIEHEQSEWYEAAIEAAGGNASSLIYRDEVHAFFNPGRAMHLPTLYACTKHLNRVFNLGYANWAQAHSLSAGADGNDDGDVLSNLYEYGLGGNPTNPLDTGILPTFGKNGETMQYIYPRRKAEDSGISYFVEVTDNLVSNVWTGSAYTESGTDDINGEFEAVTNSMLTTGTTNRFVRLKIMKK